MSFLKKIIAAAMTLVTSISTALPTVSEGKNFNPTPMHRLAVDVTDTGGTLIFSDSPEYVRSNGILYTDTVEGDARILFYHLNATGVNKKLAVVVENAYPLENRVEITRGGISFPSNNFLSVGKATQLMYMHNNFNESFKLAKGERQLFQHEMNDLIISPGHLIYGVYDFHADNPIKISVIMCPSNADPLTFIDSLNVLPKDEHKMRGTFKRMNRSIRLVKEYDPNVDGIGYVLIGDNVTDFFKRGIDATDGEEVVNYGNYGINYTIDFYTKSLTRFCLSPLGGKYAGAVRFHHDGTTGTIKTPEDSIYFGDKTPREPESVKQAREDGNAVFTMQTEISELGIYNGNVRFEYSPPGASNLPVNIILLPAE